jgi:hypothetical protein
MGVLILIAGWLIYEAYRNYTSRQIGFRDREEEEEYRKWERFEETGHF